MTFSGMLAVISVLIKPGVTALTVIPIPSGLLFPDLTNW